MTSPSDALLESSCPKSERSSCMCASPSLSSCSFKEAQFDSGCVRGVEGGDDERGASQGLILEQREREKKMERVGVWGRRQVLRPDQG